MPLLPQPSVDEAFKVLLERTFRNGGDGLDILMLHLFSAFHASRWLIPRFLKQIMKLDTFVFLLLFRLVPCKIRSHLYFLVRPHTPLIAFSFLHKNQRTLLHIPYGLYFLKIRNFNFFWDGVNKLPLNRRLLSMRLPLFWLLFLDEHWFFPFSIFLSNLTLPKGTHILKNIIRVQKWFTRGYVFVGVPGFTFRQKTCPTHATWLKQHLLIFQILKLFDFLLLKRIKI